jgi:hypothetical protein
MPVTATTFVAKFRARGYDEGDARSLREYLEPFGAVRFRPLELPEAGGTHELWLVVSFIGTAALSGIIGHVATKYYEKLSAALIGFSLTKRKKSGSDPELSLKLSYDDMDLDIGPVDEARLGNLPTLARTVLDHLQGPALNARGEITRIVIGMVKSGNTWSEPHTQDWPESLRFWGISFAGHRLITHIYDSETRLLAERPYNEDHDRVRPG